MIGVHAYTHLLWLKVSRLVIVLKDIHVLFQFHEFEYATVFDSTIPALKVTSCIMGVINLDWRAIVVSLNLL